MTPIRVLVVDDSVVIRKLLSGMISSDPELEVIGTAANGRLALAKIEKLRPDIITLDVEMPEMDGLETLTELRKTNVDLPVIMISTLTERGSAITLEALWRGASDYVAKPANVRNASEALERLSGELVPRIKALVPRTTRTELDLAADLPGHTVSKKPGPDHSVGAVMIGSSTGGPRALESVFSVLTRPLNVPVFIVQHIPPVFSRMLADRLNQVSPMRVVEATHGMIAESGTAYLAPGGFHMVVAQRRAAVVVEINEAPPVNSCRPSADVLFESAAKVYGKNQLGVILTGMGNDGFLGCERLHDLGAPILSQDRATSVVWGMPAAVTEAGYADEVLPIESVAKRMELWVSAGSRKSRERVT